jgi:hypothetical protein
MKRFLLGLLVAVFAVTLGGCFGDQVKDDLEEYRVTSNALTTKLENDLEAQSRKMNFAETPEEVVALLEEMKATMVKAKNDQATFKPKSDEVKTLNDKVQQGLSNLVDDIEMMLEGAKEENEEKMIRAMVSMEGHANELDQAEQAIFDLANEKGLNWQME